MGFLYLDCFRWERSRILKGSTLGSGEGAKEIEGTYPTPEEEDSSSGAGTPPVIDRSTAGGGISSVVDKFTTGGEGTWVHLEKEKSQAKESDPTETADATVIRRILWRTNF